MLPHRQSEAGSRASNVHSTGSRLGRRSFLGLVAANSALLAAGKGQSRGPYYVGVGYSSDPYTAASRALAASGQFPTNLAGITVVIKPNLCVPQAATTGITTDPHVVQAIVDLCITQGATNIQIIEAAQAGLPSNFTPCGYTAVFQSYPQVQLVDLRTEPYVLVPGAQYVYQSMWIPQVVTHPNTLFISAAKMKTHQNAVATLSMKNLVGLGSETAYGIPGSPKPGRHDLHYRGIDESIVDLNLVRPIQFAVIDGVWALQGDGPVKGTPVATNVVLAGVNPVAVDRTALNVMEFSQDAVPYLTYAAQAGLGPKDTSNVTLLGDKYQPYKFQPAPTPPVVWQPIPSPNTISISAGQTTTINYLIRTSCYTEVQIIQDSDLTPGVVVKRTLHGYQLINTPGESVVWDGKDDSGAPLAPGTYLARVAAAPSPTSTSINWESGRITVTT